ncbi:MAG: hypothetical protein IKC61_01775 [Clostridia bacterium]|nr:hypothetical protein [Clostridia bacterium]
MIIQSYENSPRSDACAEYLRHSRIANRCERIILLPIPTTRDNKSILNTKIYICDFIDMVDEGDVISGYGLPSDVYTALCERGALVLDLEEDEDFLTDNAELTALATLGIFLGSTKRSPRETRVGVVGYGRIGKRLTSMFLYLGATLRVFTSRKDTRLDLCECGIATAESTHDADLSGLDILINTAPAHIFDADAVPPDLRIIDLASGMNFPEGLQVERYPSVPAKMFPKSAGDAWGRSVERFINKHL